MHPEVRQDRPGACPICGMALEPAEVGLDSGPSPELIDMTRRFKIGLVLALPVLVLEMGGHIFPALHHIVPMRLSTWIQLVLATPVVLWAGWPFFVRGWASLKTRNLNMFTLIAMGTGVAWVYSMFAALAPELFPPAFRNADGSVAVYFEAAAVITVLVLLGQVLDQVGVAHHAGDQEVVAADPLPLYTAAAEALAALIARHGHPVALWGRDAATIAAMPGGRPC